MDLKKEYLELKTSFSEGGVLTRILLLLGFFFTLSSITTLSSTIVEWKGFLLDGINFYRHYYANNIVIVANLIGLKYTQAEVHTATATCIALGIGMRILAMGQKVAFRVINEKYNSDQKPNLKVFLYIGIIFTLGIWLWYGLFEPPIYTWLVVAVIALYPVFIVLPRIIMAKRDYEFYERGRFSYAKSYYAYVFAVLLIVGILAAINSGLEEMPNKNSQQDAAQDAAPLL